MATITAVPRSRTATRKGAGTGATNEKAWAGEDRYRMIAEAAYFRAERRGFVAGSELQDWLAAEIEVDELLGDSGAH
uniref:DUF2934 domain-containing protein n=1 Tax=uncultured microorganism TaxID=358574 RepID=F8UH72_9ZZZZ|nr:conserved hypothetical protein [uncultured microorganism]